MHHLQPLQFNDMHVHFPLIDWRWHFTHLYVSRLSYKCTSFCNDYLKVKVNNFSLYDLVEVSFLYYDYEGYKDQVPS